MAENEIKDTERKGEEQNENIFNTWIESYTAISRMWEESYLKLYKPWLESTGELFEKAIHAASSNSPDNYNDFYETWTMTFKVKLVAPVALEVKMRFAIREGGRTVGSEKEKKINDQKIQDENHVITIADFKGDPLKLAAAKKRPVLVKVARPYLPRSRET